MTEELVRKRNLNRYEQWARTATSFAFGVLAVLGLVMLLMGQNEIAIAVGISLIPQIIGMIMAYQGRTTFGVWSLAVGLYSGLLFLTLNTPSSFLEADSLVGRYFFPLVLLIPIALNSLEKKRERLLFILIDVVFVLFTATYGHFMDPNPGVSPYGAAMEPVVNVLVTVTILGMIFLIARNSSAVLRWINNLSIRYRITGIVLALTLPTLIILLVYNSSQSANVAEQDQEKLLESAYSGLTSTLGTWLEDNVQTLNFTAEFPAMVSMDADEQKPVLVAIDQNDPYVFLVHTTNTFGMNVARNDDGNLQDYSDRIWFTGPMAGNELTFQSLISRTIGEPALAMSVPIRSSRGTILGVLQMTFRLTALTEAIGGATVGETGLAYIVDADNILIAHPDSTYFAGDSLIDFSSDPAVAALRSGTEGIFHYVDANGIGWMAFLGTMPDYGWGVVVQLQESEIQAPVTEIRNTSYVTMLIGVAAIVLMLWLVLSRTVEPITELTQVAKDYAAGNLQARAEVRSEDEVGQLARAFNQMASDVGSQTIALAERAREMEASQRVTFAASERTTPDDFLNLLVNLIADQFDVYHCQVYLVDEERNAAVLSQSTGYAGRQLLQRRHQIPLDAQSLVTRCIQTGEPVLVAETAKDPNWLPNPLLPYTQSELVVPLKVDDKVIGVMDIQDRVAERFTTETVPVFESMTEHVAFLYQNNELLEEIEEAQKTQAQFVRQLETASEVAGQLTTILDPTQLLDQAVTMLQSRFNFYHAHIYLVDEAKQKLVVQSGSGNVGIILKERGHNIPVEAERSFVARAFRDAAPVRVNDTTKDPDWLPNPLLPDTRAEMAVPLVTRGQVIGVLDIQDETTGRFTEVDEDTMLTLAGQLATSVDTARLFVDVEVAAERDRVRFEIAQALSGNPTEEEVWDILLEKAVGERVMVLFNRVDTLPDGDLLFTSIRSKSTDPALPPTPNGVTFKLSENPAFKNMRGGEILVANDTKHDERLAESPAIRDFFQSQGIASIITAPLAMTEDEEWQGFVSVSSSVPGYFDEQQSSMYTDLIEQGTAAIRAARLRASIDQAARQTSTRLEVTQALAGNLTEDEVLDVLVEKAALYPEARFTIYYENMESPVREIVVQRDEPYATGMHPLGKGYVVSNAVMNFDNALKKDEITIFDNVYKDDRLDDATLQVMKSVGYTSIITIPLQMGEDWIGYLFITSKQEAYFDQEKVNLYSILAETGTVALRAARLRAEAAAREERFRALFNYSPDAVLVLDFETGMWMDGNANAENMFGLNHDQLLQTGPAELSPEHQPNGRLSTEYAVERINEAIQGGTNRFDWVHKDVNGREFDCEIRLAVLPGGGNDLLVNIQDITQRKAAQQAIVQGDRLKSEFLANMSHELRTPLNSILGYTDVLLMGLDGELDEEVTTDLEAIHDNSQHLLKLINDILDLAKIEAGRMTFELGDVNINTLLTEVQKTSAGLLVSKDVQMVVDADEKLPVIVADYHRVYQVVNNLVSNAVKFTEKGSITLRAFTEGEEMVVQVADTGIGIAPEDLEAIFEEFTQADTSSTRQHEGTGLGLTITRRLVQMHGGTILVESELGKGSTFSARFPLQARVDPELLVVAQSSNGKK